MDGDSVRKIVTSELRLPNSLTVDHVNSLLYWTDYLHGKIEHCNFFGKRRVQFVTSLAGPTSLTLFSKFVYWTEWATRTLMKQRKSGKRSGSSVLKGIDRITKMQAINMRKVPG